MATTGFWPVKNRLKEVIDYAENPDKTIDQKYVDKDLYAALQYVVNDKKTDKCMYVSGINCNAGRAYERMLPPEPMDENEPVNLKQALTPRCPDIRIESGRLVRFSGENEFFLKIGGTNYEVSTHFSTKGKQSVLEQFKKLILSEKLI